MNLAARLEGMCKQYGVEVLISGAMYRPVRRAAGTAGGRTAVINS